MKQLEFVGKDIEVKCLLLDPNNYRFLDNPNYKKKLKGKYHLAEVQAATLRLLEQDKRYQLAELKKSIMANGYVPMERIIVVPYEGKSGHYLVVEGNRRVAALKSLLQEAREGVTELSQTQVTSLSKIPCAILQAEPKNMVHAQRVIMGIRHIAGPREWGAYQQAQLIVELRDLENQDFQSIANHLGISTIEVSRRYRAMHALQEMEEDEHYADRATYDHYRLFHELVSLPDVRVFYGWDDSTQQFANKSKAREFFELIAPHDDDVEAKVRTYADVRKLKFIVSHPKAVAVLIDPDRTFGDALEVAESLAREKDRKGLAIADVMTEIHRALSKIDVLAVGIISNDDKKLIDDVIARLEQLKKLGVAG
ncbi:MAG: ParB N-terminal domain-containing protein [Elusimicrobiota bacterium]|jgi:hypothetical protein